MMKVCVFQSKREAGKGTLDEPVPPASLPIDQTVLRVQRARVRMLAGKGSSQVSVRKKQSNSSTSLDANEQVTEHKPEISYGADRSMEGGVQVTEHKPEISYGADRSIEGGVQVTEHKPEISYGADRSVEDGVQVLVQAASERNGVEDASKAKAGTNGVPVNQPRASSIVEHREQGMNWDQARRERNEVEDSRQASAPLDVSNGGRGLSGDEEMALAVLSQHWTGHGGGKTKMEVMEEKEVEQDGVDVADRSEEARDSGEEEHGVYSYRSAPKSAETSKEAGGRMFGRGGSGRGDRGGSGRGDRGGSGRGGRGAKLEEDFVLPGDNKSLSNSHSSSGNSSPLFPAAPTRLSDVSGCVHVLACQCSLCVCMCVCVCVCVCV